ncbi:MAG: glycosyltransferase family 4 protein [Ignavibacteriaceae bacterium]|nr:glycosyltransferase family 4 protein [Ignavibacteriaceae bacterium]
MKLLYSCLSRSWGGMEMYTLTSLLALKNNEIEVDLLCYPDSKLHLEAIKYSVNVVTIKAKSYFHPLQINKVKNTIHKNHYDIVHTHASKDLWILVPALSYIKKRIPLVLTKHVGSFIVKKDFLHRWVYSRVDLIFAISGIIKKNLFDTCPVKEKTISILYDGIDTERFKRRDSTSSSVRKEFNISENEIVIGMTGRFSPGKGQLDFLSCAEVLNKKFNNLKFLIVGEASFSEDDYASEVLLKGKFIHNVIFTGFRSDIPDVLAVMDIFVFPSHAEAFGMALVEAMSMELPSVATRSDGVLDIIDDQHDGLFFENKNNIDLADKISLLITDQGLRLRLGKAARGKVLSKFELKKVTELLINYYSNIIN